MAESQGPARGYSWEPFQPGHEVTVQHGAESPRKVGPLAVEIEQQARASSAWPAFLDDPAYGAAVGAWARAEAVVQLLWAYLAERDLVAALDELTTENSEETRQRGGPTKRVTTTRRTRSALDAWHRAEVAAANHRKALGLDPLSRAKLGKDVAVTAVQAGIAQLQSDGAELVARARAAGALTDTPTEPGAPVSGQHSPEERPR